MLLFFLQRRNILIFQYLVSINGQKTILKGMISRKGRTHGRGIIHAGDTTQNKREPLWTSAEGVTLAAATPLGGGSSLATEPKVGGSSLFGYS